MDVLNRLREDAMASGTVALLVVHKGRTIVDLGESDGEQLRPPYSITKMFVGMAIGQLVGDGRLALSTPVSHSFPEWAAGLKGSVTVEHLMRHTSGIAEDYEELATAPNLLEYVRALPVRWPPGTRFNYSNAAVQLLSGVIEQTTGQSLESFVRARTLEPLSIRDSRWYTDVVGHTCGYGGLMLSAHDLARVGQMLLQDGVWAGARVLPAGWVASMAARDSVTDAAMGAWSYGLLTILFDDVDASRRGGNEGGSFGHSGTGHQYLFVAPRSALVVVRFRRGQDDDSSEFTSDMVRLANVFDEVR
jgi:CubicO group peptidase (beta-lactamase class C family)